MIPITSIYNIAFLAATYSNVKRGSAIRAYDTNFDDIPNGHGRISDIDMEPLLKKLNINYRKVKEVEGLFTYYIAKDKKRLNVVSRLLRSKESDSLNFDLTAGRFFDYPDCCVHSYTYLRNSGARMDNLLQERRVKLGRGFRFASCFVVPCSFNCVKLSNLGNNWLRSLTDMYGYEFSRAIESYILAEHY